MSINEICFFFSLRKLMQVIIEFLSICIIDRLHYRQKFESFSRAVWGENLLYVSRGGLFIYIYPNKLSIESLQLMFDLEEKEEIFEK